MLAKTITPWKIEVGDRRTEDCSFYQRCSGGTCCMCICVIVLSTFINQFSSEFWIRLALEHSFFMLIAIFLTIILCYFINDIPLNYYNPIHIVCHLNKSGPLQSLICLFQSNILSLFHFPSQVLSYWGSDFSNDLYGWWEKIFV